MAQDNFSVNKQRIIGQIHYRPTLTSFEAVSKTAKELEEKFQDWIAPKPDSVTLYSANDKKYVEVTADTITYVKEGTQDLSELKEFIEKLYKKVTEESGVVEIRRIGFRKTQILDTSFSFNDLVDLLYKKLYSNSTEINRISGEEIRDMQFVLDSVKNTFLNHVQIGPLKKTEIPNYFSTKFVSRDDMTEVLPDQALFVDIDVSLKDALTTENALEKLAAIIEENERIGSDYLEYLQS